MKHEVDVLVPERKLGRSDIEFKLRLDGKAAGILKVSRGALVWVPRDCTLGHKLTCAEFASMMQVNGARESGKN